MIEREPTYDVGKLRWFKRDLVVPSRMRSDFSLVKAPSQFACIDLSPPAPSNCAVTASRNSLAVSRLAASKQTGGCQLV